MFKLGSPLQATEESINCGCNVLSAEDCSIPKDSNGLYFTGAPHTPEMAPPRHYTLILFNEERFPLKRAIIKPHLQQNAQ